MLKNFITNTRKALSSKYIFEKCGAIDGFLFNWLPSCRIFPSHLPKKLRILCMKIWLKSIICLRKFPTESIGEDFILPKV